MCFPWSDSIYVLTYPGRPAVVTHWLVPGARNPGRLRTAHNAGHQTRSVCDDALMPVADHQTLRVLEGRYVLERAVPDVEVAREGEVLAVVRGPDGGACMRRQDAADDAWVALWNGDEAHPPDAAGMLAAIVAPLAAGHVPVWVAASFDGDIVMIPADRVDEASELLRRAGHRVIG
jgi:hypothetical protein